MSLKWISSASINVSPAGGLLVQGLVPAGEVDLVPLVLNSAADFVLDLSGYPDAAILLVRSDGAFVEGRAVPNPATNLVRDGEVLHAIPVAGAAAWHFKRTGTTTVTLKGKLYRM